MCFHLRILFKIDEAIKNNDSHNPHRTAPIEFGLEWLITLSNWLHCCFDESMNFSRNMHMASFQSNALLTTSRRLQTVGQTRRKTLYKQTPLWNADDSNCCERAFVWTEKNHFESLNSSATTLRFLSGLIVVKTTAASAHKQNAVYNAKWTELTSTLASKRDWLQRKIYKLAV